MTKPLLLLLCISTLMPTYATQNITLAQCITTVSLLATTVYDKKSNKDRDKTYFTEHINKLRELTKVAFNKLEQLENEKDSLDLINAINHRDYKRAKQILKDKPKLHINSLHEESYTSCLMRCCCQGDKGLSLVREMLKHPDMDITVKSVEGFNCVHVVCYNTGDQGCYKIAKHLLNLPNIDKLLNEKWNYCDNMLTPLDCILDRMSCGGGDHNLSCVAVWNMMVAKGARLNHYKKDYKTRNFDWKDRETRRCLELFRQNPPHDMKELAKEMFVEHDDPFDEDSSDSSDDVVNHEEETKEEE